MESKAHRADRPITWKILQTVGTGTWDREKRTGSAPEEYGHAIGSQGRNDAGNQAGIINYADADDFHGEKGSGQRSAEQCGKNSAHAAHDEDMLILFIQVKQAADLRADGASQLQGCALPPGGTAAEMGDDGADKNERGQGKWDSFLASDGIQNLVCAEIFRCFTKMIQSDNDQTAYGQQV